jgi:signal transduction histidine kinase
MPAVPSAASLVPRGRSVTWYLALFSAALLAPALVVIAVLSWRSARASQGRIDRAVRDEARAVAGAFDRAIAADRIMLTTLASAPSATPATAVAFRDRARAIAPATDSTLAILLRLPDGRIVADTRTEGGAPRPFVTDVDEVVRRSRRPMVSNTVIDPLTGARDLAVVAPVLDGDRVAALLTVLRPAAHQLALLRGSVPQDVVAASWSDRNGIVLARTRDHAQWSGTPITPQLRRALVAESGTWTGPSHEGIPLLGGYARSVESGWLVAVGVERRRLAAPLQQSVATIGSALLLLALLGAWLAYAVGRRITGPVLALADDAAQLGRVGALAPRAFGVREVDGVHAALVSAAAAVAQREAALALLNSELEARVQERTAELVQLRKTESIGQLTGGIAHDFNNLLAVVLGNLSLVKKRLPVDDARTRQLVEHAIQGAQRGAALTQRMLSFARRQALAMAPVDVPALVHGMRDLLERSVGPGVTLVLDLADALPPARTDANQLELALLNLAINARDAMPDGGTLRLAASRAAIRDGAHALADGDYVRIDVVDSGTGMPPEVQARATEPFYTTKGVGKGTGLGLPMVLGLAQQCGGALTIASAPGAGTTMTLHLPVATQPVPTPVAIPVVVEATVTTPRRVLVVDDDALVRANVVAMLEDLGHDAIDAGSAEEALGLLRTGARVDVVVTDHAMPGMTGLELAARLAQERPTLPVVLATGFADLPEGTRIAVPRLAKPFTQDELARALNRRPDRVPG